MKQIDIKKSDPRVARFIKLCFPADRTRRAVKVSPRETCYVRDYWDGGSRDYTEFVHIPTMSRRSIDSLDFEKQTAGNPFDVTMGELRISPDIAVVISSVFRGKNAGIRIYVHPDRFPEFA